MTRKCMLWNYMFMLYITILDINLFPTKFGHICLEQPRKLFIQEQNNSGPIKQLSGTNKLVLQTSCSIS